MNQVNAIRMPFQLSILVCSLITLGDFVILPAFAQVEPHEESPSEQAAFSAEQIEFFESKVRPILVENCFECHGTDTDSLEGGLSLASRRSILDGGDSGPAIDLNSPGESLMLSAVEYGDLFQMPPDKQLPVEQIAILRKWITEGAAWPETDETHVVVVDAFDLESRRESHWCWHPVQRPEVPAAGDDWAIDPIDRFILAKLQEHDLAPASPASRETWIRRATFDLTGLPPTSEEIDTFLNDDSANAHEKVVDRLLASSHFGERWARHWMDLIRYAETCGHEFDYPIPNAWQYRDYLIRAFNADVPYNDLVVEHIAGDLDPDPRRNPENDINESVLGTGYWFLGEATHGPVDVKGDEAGHIDNQIDVMCKTFLGLTVACARCHDHKFDAIATKDYYALAGFLQSSRRQDVMLDPGRKIEIALEQIRTIDNAASAKIANLIESIDPHVFEQFPQYMEAAVLYMQRDRSWQHRDVKRIEGETIEGFQQTAGTVETQKIDGFDKWSNGSQLWWKEAKTGDRLSFDVTAPASAEFDVRLKLTIASDYGIVQPYINGKAVGEPIDCYSASLSTTGLLDLGKLQLNEGANKFEFEIVGKNEAAIPLFMFGIDFIEIGLDEDLFGGIDRAARLESICESNKLETDTLKCWIRALSDSATANVHHPLYLLRRAAESAVDLESDDGADFFVECMKTIELAERQAETSANKCTIFSTTCELDFEFETPTGFDLWHSTGLAFRNWESHRGLNLADRDNPVWRWSTPDVVAPPHSGCYGSKLQGVLSSPTFEITKPFIHYYVSAHNAKIRLIIDGYQLDTYNALLFNGMTMPVDTDGNWKWVVQGGDLKNHIGHRAYIEIIDDGEGFIGVQEVRFSDDPTSPSGPPVASWTSFETGSDNDEWHRLRPESSLTALEHIAEIVSRSFQTNRVTDPVGEVIRDHELFNFMLRHRLFRSFDDESIRIAIEEPMSQMQAIADTIPAPALAIGMTDGSPENEFVFIRGNHKNLGEEANRRPLTAFEFTSQWNDLVLAGSGRLELAKDLIRPENPLVARVMVNRIWHHLTGKGIVPSVDNFGVLGDKPTHPELLDYLASEFVDQGWSIKKLIRRVVLSQSYRMSSVSSEGAAEADPNNDLLHAFRVRRLEGEAIRDAMLVVSGELDRTLYGAPVPIHLTDFMQGRGRPGESGPLDGNRRRSLYTEIRRNFLSPMMLAFDTPIPFNAMGRRNQSNVPAQSLILLNDPFVIDQAEKWAKRLIETVPDPQKRLQTAFRAATGRLPTESELVELSLFVESQAALLGVPPQEVASSKPVWTDTCHVIFNLKEFIYLN